jgi:hypothetical protein
MPDIGTFVIVPANGSRHLDLGPACLYRSACPARQITQRRAPESRERQRLGARCATIIAPGHRHARKCLLPDACTHSCRRCKKPHVFGPAIADIWISTGRLVHSCRRRRRRRFPGTYVSYYNLACLRAHTLWICMLPGHASVRRSTAHHVRTRPSNAEQRQLLCRPLGVHSDLPSRNSIHPCYERNTD